VCKKKVKPRLTLKYDNLFSCNMVQRKYCKSQYGSGGLTCCAGPNTGSIPPDKLELLKSYNNMLKSKIPYKN